MVVPQRSREIRVGLFVLGSLILFVVLVTFVVGSSWRTEKQYYRIRFDESVKGMVVGSKVNFQGVPIGSVSDIRFASGSTLVEIAVDAEKASVQRATVARLDRLLVTGQVTIELEGWNEDSEPLEEGSMIRAMPNPLAELTLGLPDVVHGVDVLIYDARRVLGKIDAALSDENIERSGRILERLEELCEQLPRQSDALLAELRGVSAELTPAIAQARTTFRTLSDGVRTAVGLVDRDQVAALFHSAEHALVRFAAMESSWTALGEEARGLLGDNRQSARHLFTSARETLRDLQALARQLRRAPSSVLFGSESAELAVPSKPSYGGRNP